MPKVRPGRRLGGPGQQKVVGTAVVWPAEVAATRLPQSLLTWVGNACEHSLVTPHPRPGSVTVCSSGGCTVKTPYISVLLPSLPLLTGGGWWNLDQDKAVVHPETAVTWSGWYSLRSPPISSLLVIAVNPSMGQHTSPGMAVIEAMLHTGRFALFVFKESPSLFSAMDFFLSRGARSGPDNPSALAVGRPGALGQHSSQFSSEFGDVGLVATGDNW